MSRPPPDPVYVMRGHKGPVSSLGFLTVQECSYLFSGSSNGEIFGWDLETFRPRYKLLGHHETDLLWIDHVGEHLLTQGRDGQVNLWKLRDKLCTVQRSFTCQGLSFCQGSILKGVSTRLAVPSKESSIELFDVESGQTLCCIHPGQDIKLGMLMCMKIINEGTYIAAGYENGSVCMFDIRTEEMVSNVSCFSDPVICLDFDDLHKHKGIVGSTANELIIFEGRSVLRVTQKIPVCNAGVSCVAVRGDGRIVASGGWDSRVRLHGWSSLKPLAVLSFHKECCTRIRFSDDVILNYGLMMAVGSKDKTVSLWNLYS